MKEVNPSLFLQNLPKSPNIVKTANGQMDFPSMKKKVRYQNDTQPTFLHILDVVT